MVQPASATVISAGNSARDAGPAASAMAVTRSTAPGRCGAATSTGTSATAPAPGSGSGTVTGRGVLTAGPSTRTVTGPPPPAGLPPPPARITRTSCSGRLTVPANRSVD